MLSRECTKCNKIITYSNLSNLRRAERLNKICKSCAQQDLKMSPKYSDRNMSISKKRIEYFKNIGEDEHLRQIDKMKTSLKKTYDDKPFYWKENWKTLCSQITKERWSNEEYKIKVRESMRENNWTKRDDRLEIIEKVMNTKMLKYGKTFHNGRCKEYNIGNLICYGKTELKFINKLILESSELPSNFSGIIETPFGKYNPDFEYSDRFIEIKSDFTFDVLLGKKSYSKNKPSNPLQLKKILWVSENIKSVKVILVNDSINEFDYDYLINFIR